MTCRCVFAGVGLALLVGLPRASSAQTCAGAMSFNFAPLQIGGSPGWSGEGRVATASVAAGADRLFGAFSTGVTFAGADRRHVAHAAVALGADQPLRLDNRLHLCPIATVSYARGRASGAAVAGGRIAVGWVARNAAGLTIVPAAGVGVQRSAELQAAVGFILRGRAAITPRVTFARRQPATLALELTIDAR
jgi:hypothetical protein